MMQKPMVSIIIPVYNAGIWLRRTMHCLQKQTYQNLQIIFIDDCSTDNSALMLEDDRLAFGDAVALEMLRHEKNRGVAAARNTGLDKAKGDYIYFLDADDWIEPDAIALMVERARETEADIVGFNWWLSFQNSEREMKQPTFSDPWEAMEMMMQGIMRWNLWMFLVRRELYEANAIRFTSGKNMGEDLLVTIKLFACAGKVSYLDKALYHYVRSNEESLTKVYSERHMEEVTYNVKEVEYFLLNSTFAAQSVPLINYLKLNIKLPLLISDKKSHYERWRAWFPEANSFAVSGKVSKRIRLLQWAAANKQDWIVKLHYYLVIRFVYGVLYR